MLEDGTLVQSVLHFIIDYAGGGSFMLRHVSLKQRNINSDGFLKILTT